MNSSMASCSSCEKCKTALLQLLEYCHQNHWSGFDPYDGLNGPVIAHLPFSDNRLSRLLIIQGIKRSPLNFRPVLRIPRQQNPKGIALFCATLIKLTRIKAYQDDKAVLALLDRLLELKSPQRAYNCWGYNFPWQNRTTLIPPYEPNIVTSVFAANALIEAYDLYLEPRFLTAAASTGYFILSELNRIENGDELCFSYTPLDHTFVHNANLLGAELLARLYSRTHEKEFRESCLKAAKFSVNRQNQDGSWFYGTASPHQWIDNFHTGYNLSALVHTGAYLDSKAFENPLLKGYQFYCRNFFTEKGLPKYYHNKIYPIDIHTLAQSIITFADLDHLDGTAKQRAHHILDWTITNMQDREGYFYFQKWRYYTNKIAYMRWSQAWMLYAISVFAEKYYDCCIK